MDGQIITSGEQRQAGDHARAIEAVIANNPTLAAQLSPAANFLHALYWKGAQR